MQVKIRPLEIDDAYTSVKWRNDKDVFKYTGNVYNQEITIEDELLWIKNVIKKEDEYRCAIIVDDVYVGNAYLTDINGFEAQYHIFIGEKEYWGKGVAKLASLLILQYGFDKLGLKRIYLEVRPENESAISLYKKLGFENIGNTIGFIRMELKALTYRLRK